MQAQADCAARQAPPTGACTSLFVQGDKMVCAVRARCNACTLLLVLRLCAMQQRAASVQGSLVLSSQPGTHSPAAGGPQRPVPRGPPQQRALQAAAGWPSLGVSAQLLCSLAHRHARQPAAGLWL